ncbi:MAG TPA: hypothetical protein VK157_11520 [Phycisphaerales bacterium]|nr:hypothetical protein [Phycisphaerales bacterium]
MNRRIAATSLALSLFLIAGSAHAADAQAPRDVAADYPGVQTMMYNGRPSMFYGAPMTSAQTDQAAADAWLANYGQQFQVGDLDLRIRRVNPVAMGRFTVFAYDQYLDGLPVELSQGRVLVKNAQVDGVMTHEVVMTSARLAKTPEGGFAPVTVTADDAITTAKKIGRFATLDTWSQPELVVFFGEGDFDQWMEPVKAWKFVGEMADVSKMQRFTFFVDASTNELLHARSEILHADITGQVRGFASPNNTADIPSNPPALTDIPEIRVTVENTTTTVTTDRNGNFTIPWSGNTPVNLVVSVTNAERGVVDSTVDGEVTITQSVTPGTPALITLNPTPAENPTSQLNALIHTTITRNFFADRAPSFASTLDTINNSTTPTRMTINVMLNDVCNAFYNGSSTNFFASGLSGTTQCNNSAIPSVVAHEYGHHIVNRLGLAQGAFGEGFSDSMALLIYNDAVMGRGFTATNGLVRNPDTANRQYPCTSTAIHTCGLILGGVTWDIRTGFITTYGSTQGLELARQTHVDWALVTNGGQGLNSMHPETAIEYLTIDDDDGRLCNGTPNYSIIRQGFINHGIPVPPTDARLNAALVSTNPSSLLSGEPLTVVVEALPGTSSVTPGSARLLYRHDGSNQFYTTQLDPIGNNRYSGTIPAGLCGQTLEYRFTFGTAAGTFTFPFGCLSGTSYSVPVNDGTIEQVTGLQDNDGGWTRTDPAVGAATAGNWTWGDPLQTIAQPASGFDGNNCWFTGQGTNGNNAGEADIDNGRTILTTVDYNVSGYDTPVVSYQRWFINNASTSNPNEDVMTIEYSVNGGSTWQLGETVGPLGTGTGWREGGFVPNMNGSNTIRVRFTAADEGVGGSLVEAAIDNFRISSVQCNPGCADIDYNNNGVFPEDQDVIDFFAVLAGGTCSTGNCDPIDFNRNEVFPEDSDVISFFGVLAGGSCQ